MTTAREALAKQLHELMKSPFQQDTQDKVNDLLSEFRVQAKPGTEVQAGSTARESLGKQIAAIWKRGPKDLERSVEALLDKYRMQLKKEGGSPVDKAEGAIQKPAAAPKPAHPKPSQPAVTAAVAASPATPSGKVATTPTRTAVPAARPAVQAAAPAPRATPAKSTPIPPPRKTASLPPPRPGGGMPTPIAPRAAPQSVTPLFPGTPTGPSKRSECPKCKSRGVVLARSYTQEEYFSCIYCGWQAFKPFEEATADSPLAARLLSQRPAVPKRKEEVDEEGGRKRSVIEEDDETRSRSVILDESDMPARSTPAVRPDDSVVEEEPEPGVDRIIHGEDDDDDDIDFDTGRDLEE